MGKLAYTTILPNQKRKQEQKQQNKIHTAYRNHYDAYEDMRLIDTVSE